MDLALNNLQRLIRHKTQPTNYYYNYYYLVLQRRRRRRSGSSFIAKFLKQN